MKKIKKIVAALLVAIMATGMLAGITCAAEKEPFGEVYVDYDTLMKQDLSGKTIILHTNDVHGMLDGYAYLKALSDDILNKEKGAMTFLVDNGDFIQGSVDVSQSKGKSATELMIAAGYNIVGLGNHEFDYGPDVLKERISELTSKGIAVINANVFNKSDESTFIENHSHKLINTEADNLSIEFLSVDTPELLTACSPKMVAGLDVAGKDKMAEIINDWAKNSTADVKIVLGHLGIDEFTGDNRSIKIWEKVKDNVDFMIDGHSHSTFSYGENESQKIQQTGTKFENIGVIVIDNASKKITDNFLIKLDDTVNPHWMADETVKNLSDKIKEEIQEELKKVIGKSLVDLNGDRGDEADKTEGNRNIETNQGDFVTDAVKWYAQEYDDSLIAGFNKDNLIGLMNGGGIRAWIKKGDISEYDIIQSYPFNNTLNIVFVKGKTLLRVLEAATGYAPSPMGGFPQVSGIEYNIDDSKEFDFNKNYPGTTWGRPNSVQRVTIKSVNGKDFDPDATYAVATTDFVAIGGDNFYEFKEDGTCKDSGILLPDVIELYIKEKLGGVIGTEYEKPQGRITYGKYVPVPKTADETPAVMIAFIIMAMAAAAGTCIVCVRKYKKN